MRYLLDTMLPVVELLRSMLFLASAVSNQASDLYNDPPEFVKQPPSTIYYSAPSTMITSIKFTIAVRPPDSILDLFLSRQALAYRVTPVNQQSQSMHTINNNNNTGPSMTILSRWLFDQNEYFNTAWYHLQVRRVPVSEILSLLASNRLGTVRSRPMDLRLAETPEAGFNESVDGLIGNTVHILCPLFDEKPGSKNVQFYHNNSPLNTENEGRYKVVQLLNRRWQDLQLVFDVELSSSTVRAFPRRMAILLIHSLQSSDSGRYFCRWGTSPSGDYGERQGVRLNVIQPHRKVTAHLRFSSADRQLASFYNLASKREAVDKIVTLTVKVGQDLTLFCIFESAPVAAVVWYFETPNDRIVENSSFGTLTFINVSIDQEGEYTCAGRTIREEAVSQTFRLLVQDNRILVPSPGKHIVIPHQGAELRIRCISEGSSAPDGSEQHRSSNSANLDFRTRRYRQLQRPPLQRVNAHKTGWFHNGRSIEDKPTGDTVQVKGLSLRIRNVTKNDTGVYQCWKVDEDSLWRTTSFTVGMDKEEFQPLAPPSVDKKSTAHDTVPIHQESFVEEFTRDGLTGHLTCHPGSIFFSHKSNTTRSNPHSAGKTLWFRYGNQGQEYQIHPGIKQSSGGQIKYLASEFEQGVQILSIVNPRRGRDDGLYSCKILNHDNTFFVGELKFRLIIEPNDDVFVGYPGRVSRLHSGGTSSAETNGNQEVMMKAPIEKEPINNKEVKTGDSKSGKPPTVRQNSNYSLDVYITWAPSINDNRPASQSSITIYHIQYRLSRSRDSRRAEQQSMPTSDGGIVRQANESDWSETRLLAIAEGEAVRQCLVEGSQFQTNVRYSFRIVSITTPLSTTSPSRDAKLTERNVSPWSEGFTFQRLVNIRPQLLNVTPMANDRLLITWSLQETEEVNQDVINLQPPSTVLLSPALLYKAGANLTTLPSRRSIKCGTYLDQFAGFEQVHTNQWTRFDQDRSAKYNYNLGGLQADQLYTVAFYIEFRSNTNGGENRRSFSRLSNQLTAKTFTFARPFHEGNPERSITLKNLSKLKPYMINTSESSESRKTLQKMESKGLHGSQAAQSTKFEDQIVSIIVLGCLATTLILISVALVIFCLCHYLRGWCAYHQDYRSPIGKHAITVSSSSPTSMSQQTLNNKPDHHVTHQGDHSQGQVKLSYLPTGYDPQGLLELQVTTDAHGNNYLTNPGAQEHSTHYLGASIRHNGGVNLDPLRLYAFNFDLVEENRQQQRQRHAHGSIDVLQRPVDRLKNLFTPSNDLSQTYPRRFLQLSQHSTQPISVHENTNINNTPIDFIGRHGSGENDSSSVYSRVGSQMTIDEVGALDESPPSRNLHGDSLRPQTDWIRCQVNCAPRVVLPAPVDKLIYPENIRLSYDVASQLRASQGCLLTPDANHGQPYGPRGRVSIDAVPQKLAEVASQEPVFLDNHPTGAKTVAPATSQVFMRPLIVTGGLRDQPNPSYFCLQGVNGTRQLTVQLERGWAGEDQYRSFFETPEDIRYGQQAYPKRGRSLHGTGVQGHGEDNTAEHQLSRKRQKLAKRKTKRQASRTETQNCLSSPFTDSGVDFLASGPNGEHFEPVNLPDSVTDYTQNQNHLRTAHPVPGL